jgi:isopenicillin-N epimerase
MAANVLFIAMKTKKPGAAATGLNPRNRIHGRKWLCEKRVGKTPGVWHECGVAERDLTHFAAAHSDSESDLRRPAPSSFRRHWALASGLVYLNHGAFGACPKPILKVQEEMRREMEASPVQFLWRRFEERLEPSRHELARFVGARPQDIVFVGNATTGVNAVLRSLRLRHGDELLTTSLDYNACRNVLVETARASGARIVVADVPFPLRSSDEIVEAALAKVTTRTRLAMLDHVTSDTGIIVPISTLIRELTGRGVETLIDGAHAAGMLPLNLSKLGASYYTANLHKWVCAPKGAAFLWVREDKQPEIQPPVISHGNNRPRAGFTPFQDRFDWPATFDPTAWFCVKDAIEWMRGLMSGGWRELREHNHSLVASARDVICAELGVEPPCPSSMLGSLATIPLPNDFPDAVRREKIDEEQALLYDRYSIEVPFSRFGARRWIRISAQIYNSMAEYEYLAAVLRRVRGGRG